uniref:NR LBD domain-containing protein n=1 Tax=Globodera pallida TaxID=36090 RepID=A0A183BQR4_GLOPA
MRPFILYKTIFILFIFIIEGYTMMDYLTVPEGSTIVIEHPFFSQFEILNEPKILVQQENAIEYFKLIHEILEDIDYTDNYCTKAEEQIEKMNNNINKKLHQNRQKFGDNLWAIVVKLSRFCQRIGLNQLNSTQQIGNRSFGKKLCRLAMFVALAEFFSIEMKKILALFPVPAQEFFGFFIGRRRRFLQLLMVLILPQNLFLLAERGKSNCLAFMPRLNPIRRALREYLSTATRQQFAAHSNDGNYTTIE